jgi:hypothetical protein
MSTSTTGPDLVRGQRRPPPSRARYVINALLIMYFASLMLFVVWGISNMGNRDPDAVPRLVIDNRTDA